MTTADNMVTNTSILLGMPTKVANEIVDKLNLSIGSAIHDAIKNNEQAVVLNIGIGNLGIDLTSMQCKFVPSKALKTTIKESIAAKVDPLELRLEDALIEKLISICDEVI